ncbi:MAG TPA: homoserine dehydrogenase [Syntrophales bacterium]|jgi:homoserine dehydrogenase|nr:homoserine dehydrogenase [Syntrophales bacterium]HON23804.1 homoserine dehydrogenase [Syntrophales bacterium]HOU76654.1 homoserine dehydrogenase [Syntrophales bacterium]HPC31411.1 homoserine dehydrogenase [Syntrophales bacterium]HQG33317.1 homoserine dehydrogenase [Syntrophales bacterium]
MKKISLGLIGFGTIGSGVVKLLRENGDLIERRLGARLDLKRIADLDITTPRVVAVPPELLTTEAEQILTDPEIDIVIELMGGYEPARSFIMAAMERRKHVVTANKALLATYGNEIFRTADRQKVDIRFEASVGGTIPIIKTLKESLVGNRITSFMAIMNGTSNYILSKMTDEGKSFAAVLKEAQELGFAEADPTFDVEGIDTAHKLAIALSLAYGKRVNMEEIYREGIAHISQQDIEFAKEFGYRIKLLALAFARGDSVEARIHPTMIPNDVMLANVNSNYNAFHIVGSASGAVFLYGQGAGMMPTASAVVSDVIDIARGIIHNACRLVPYRSMGEDVIDDIQLIPFPEIKTNYYFRFMAADKAGVLSKISGILGEVNISIASVIQKGRKKEGAVPVVMTTHKARERDVREALQRIDRLDVVHEPTVLIRIEDERL